MIRAAIFDLDGTILDSMGYWQNCGELLVRSYGLEPEPNLSEKLFRFSMADGAEYLQKNYFSSWSIKKVSEEIINVLADSYKNEIQLKKGSQKVLQMFYDKKIPCTLATATPRELFYGAFERLKLEKYFKNIFTCPELNTNKDSPKIYREAAASLGTQVEDCLVFEDVLVPIRTAKMAGFKTVGVFDQYSASETHLIMKYSDIFVSSLDEGLDKILETFSLK